MRNFCFALLLPYSLSALAGGGVNPIAFENYIADNSTAINSVTSLANQATQIQKQIESITYQVKNSGVVNNYQWQNITDLVKKLDSTTQQGQALSYASSNLDAQFKQKYPDFTNSQQGQVDYTKTYQNWNTSTLDTLRSTLEAAGLNANDFNTEQDTLKELERQGRTAKGRMQIIQVSSEISAQSVNQLEELKRVIVSQTNAQNGYMAYKVSKDAYDEKNLESLAGNADATFPKYQNNSKLGEIPSMGGN